MKCPHCPKEISEEKEGPSSNPKYASKGITTNPDYDKHIKLHIKQTIK